MTFRIFSIRRVTGYRLALLMGAVLLTSCGFHLRGSVDIPKDTGQLAIDDGESATAIATTLHTHLRRNGIKPLQNISEAKLVIEIHREGFQRRVLTVNSAGQVQEFELTYHVSYSLLNKESEDASLKGQSLVLRRDLRFDANEVLGKSSEEERLRHDMLDSAAQQILRRVPKVAGSSSS